MVYFAYDYRMHVNLYTTLFYDLVLLILILLIECSYWISSPSFPCAKQFGVIMHSEMKGGAMYITDSQPVINNNDLV